MPQRREREARESLRLLQAFTQVMDQAAREHIIALAETLSRGGNVEKQANRELLIN